MLTFDLFSGLPDDCMRRIDAISDVRECVAGTPLFDGACVGQHAFLLEAGTVHTYRVVGRRRLIVAELTAPALFGEMVLFGNGTYLCSAEAITTARVRSLPRAELEALLDGHPVFARRLLDVVAGRFVTVLTEFESASSRLLLPRVAELLLHRAVGNVVDDLTHQDIASRLRVHRESVSSALGELRRAGILSVERKRIRILHRARLERASRERD